MKLLILLQILMAAIEICKPEDEPKTTIILNDTRTEMTVEQEGLNNLSRSKTNEFFDGLGESENDGNDLDFDYDDGEDVVKADMRESEQEMQAVMLKAMKKPAIRKQIGEVIPILRAMSPAQRLTLAALVSSQIMSQNSLSESNLTEMAARFAGKNVENADDRHNITEHLLLPISMDIAKMFKGLGKEMGRNLRQNFYRPVDNKPNESQFRRRIRKPEYEAPAVMNRRMDDGDYDQSEETNESSTMKPVAEALKQPGKDECDFFTKSLCLEVSNYPTEAIISSLRNNKDIAKTFLTDFDVQPIEEVPNHGKRNSGRRFERRQDGQNEIQDLAPEGGYMCPSSVKYARPKRARTTSGQWKYVVNAGDYTQTLRLEICQKPKSPCSYVTNHLNSQCAQVFNYHRLLTWDESKGLHMDIFKVPSCCSCHVQGYSTFYPPNNDYTYAEKRKEPLETPEFVTERQAMPERPLYNNFGNKREVQQVIPLGSPPTVAVKTLQQHPVNFKEFFRNPVDHLVPPGPPLPLENEGNFNQQPDIKYYEKKESLEHILRFPTPIENNRISNKSPEQVETNHPTGGLTLTSKTRLKAPVASPQQRPNLKVSQNHYPLVVPSLPQEATPVFDATNQIRFVQPLGNSPPPFPNLEIKREKPKENGLFVTPTPIKDLFIQSGLKANSKQSVQFFKPEINDAKSLPSRVTSFYVTPPKKKQPEIRVHTTTTPPQKSEFITSSGQRKINYNYHPIIDFFLTDSKKNKPTFSAPQLKTTGSQDWTPVLGH